MQEILNYEFALNSKPAEATEGIIDRATATKIALFAGIIICLLLAVII